MLDFPDKDKYGLQDFRLMVELLRHEGGCPWDMEQTHASLRRNTLEEAYGVCGAIDEDDPVHLREELGDLLLHVLFHTGIEEDAGRFDLDEVCDAAVRKLLYRHPHVFGGEEVSGAQEVADGWEKIKERERSQSRLSEIMESVTPALPALWRAEKLMSRRASAGKGLPDIAAAAALVREKAAAAGESPEALGELLYAACELARHLGAAPEEALHAACDRDIARQRSMEDAQN